MVEHWQALVIGWLTICALIISIWFKGIRPMMKALGTLLDTPDRLDKLERNQRLMQKRLNKIERNTNGH